MQKEDKNSQQLCSSISDYTLSCPLYFCWTKTRKLLFQDIATWKREKINYSKEKYLHEALYVVRTDMDAI
jgi:hypothetical protein